MSQDIILKRELKTQTWLIQGEIATAASRPELNCVLQYLKDFPSSNASQCSKHLFGDEIGRRVVADRLLNIARNYRLAEAERGNYHLTDIGLEALQKEQVLIPEDGCWEICVCNDPLLRHAVMSIEPHNEPSAALTGLNKNRNKLNERARKLQRIPKTVLSTVGLQVEPVAGGYEVRIDKIESKGEQLVLQGKPFYIEWNITGGSISVIKGRETINSRRVEPVARNKVLRAFLRCEGLLSQWDDQLETLTVNFDETTEVERVVMKRELKISNPEVREMGTFEPLTIPNISISACTVVDANNWAMWRLQNSINMYALADKYDFWKERALAPFTEFNCSLPDRNTLAKDLLNQNDRHNQDTWHVIAANDWNL